MVSNSVKACHRCHHRKVRCTGFPNCRGCREAQVPCEAYNRPRRSEASRALKQAQARIRWLEDTLTRELGGEYTSLPTATSPAPTAGKIASEPHAPLEQTNPVDLRVRISKKLSTELTTATRQLIYPRAQTPDQQGRCISASPGNDDSEIGLLALNATGELKYLGPSSGAFFSNYAASLVRACFVDRGRQAQAVHSRTSLGGIDCDSVEGQTVLHADDIKTLLTSYELWIHPLYPLFDLEALRDLVSRCSQVQHSTAAEVAKQPELAAHLTTFYLIMALGAINHASTIKHLQQRPDQTAHAYRIMKQQHASSELLYAMALRYLDMDDKALRPSFLSIRTILLVCIYSSSGPIGSSQWQLAGLAMRMSIEIGLHFALRSQNMTDRELDDRSRVFWTAYAIEISLAFNLGRPPSISEEHISTAMPLRSNDMPFGIAHIKHRRIQARIISQVYCGAAKLESLAAHQRRECITNLQRELDEWWADLSPQSQSEPATASAYPRKYWDRLYHGTTFVLHRASPLYPQPPVESLQRCIRSAGAYIDDMADVLRTSNVPLSWMLVQGILFAGLTMLITARTSFRQLASHTGLSFLLIQLPAWARKCSVSLAVVNERWNEELIAKLEAQFEMLADSTLATISTILTTPANEHTQQSTGTPNISDPRQNASVIQDNQFADQAAAAPVTHDPLAISTGTFYDDGWADMDMDLFRDFMGMDGSQPFWDFGSLPIEGGPTML